MPAWLPTLKLTLRRLHKNPGFTLTALLVLAVGIGATSTLFAVVHAVLLEPLPFPDPERLVRVRVEQPASGERSMLSYPDFRELAEGGRSFEHLSAYRFASFFTSGTDEPLQLRAARVDDAFFAALGVEAERGRTFRADENGPSSQPLVVLRHDFWQTQLGGRPGVVGSTLELDGEPHTVLGVMPAGFDFPTWAEVWMPLGDPTAWDRDRIDIRVLGRLAEGAPLSRAAAETGVVGERLAHDHPDTFGERAFLVRTLLDDVVGEHRRRLSLVFGAVLGLLLVV
ncbi:MAG: ABC transporter permease, partial [Holophagales bacterium]|nr:ABC transporter permease [Holophagales bacterium]